MKKMLFTILLLWGATVQATTIIALTPSSTVASLGDTVTLDLVATGLAPPSGFPIESYTLDIFWDSAALLFQSFAYSGALGNHSLAEANGLSDFSLSTGGQGTLAEQSTLPGLALAALQPDNANGVVLASLSFQVLSFPDVTSTDVTTSSMIVQQPVIGESAFNGVSASILATGVPSPAPMTLFGFGLLLLAIARRKHLMS